MSAYVREHLARQDARKASLEQRGIGVVTTSGALVTLLFGLAALSTKEAQTFSLPKSAGYLLVIAIVLFFAAAVTAILTNVPLEYDELRITRLRGVLKTEERIAPAEVERKNAITDLDILESAKERNQAKARILFWAMGFEVAAVAFVAAAIGIVVNGPVFFAALGAAVLILGWSYVRAYGRARPQGGAIAELLNAAISSFGRSSDADSTGDHAEN